MRTSHMRNTARNAASMANESRLKRVVNSGNAGAEIFDFTRLTQVQIAVEAEKACHLPSNKGSCDYEAFILKYSTRPTGDFA